MNKKQTYMQSMEVLGSTAELRLVSESAALVDSLFPRLWGEVVAFEDRFSRFSSKSELSRFNERAGEKISVSEEFKHVLERARYFSSRTDGSFNPFMLPGLQRAGYVASMTEPFLNTPDYALREIVSYEELEIGDTWARIPPNTALDLGGIGKGYCADLLTEHLDRHIRDYCLSLGGDMCVSGQDQDGPWVITIQSAQDTFADFGTYTSTEGGFGIATSGTLRTKLGREQEHLIDPKTGAPAETPYSLCTVVAHDAATADVLASCILIEGKEFALKLFNDGEVQAVLLQGKPGTPPVILGEGFECTHTQLTVPHNVSTYV